MGENNENTGSLLRRYSACQESSRGCQTEPGPSGSGLAEPQDQCSEVAPPLVWLGHMLFAHTGSGMSTQHRSGLFFARKTGVTEHWPSALWFSFFMLATDDVLCRHTDLLSHNWELPNELQSLVKTEKQTLPWWSAMFSCDPRASVWVKERNQLTPKLINLPNGYYYPKGHLICQEIHLFQMYDSVILSTLPYEKASIKNSPRMLSPIC